VTDGESERETGVERPTDPPDGESPAEVEDVQPADEADVEPSDQPSDQQSDESSDEPGAEDDQAWLEVSPEEAEARRQRHHERREEHRRKVRRRKRRKRILIGSSVALASLLVLGIVWFWWMFGSLERMPQSVGQVGAEAPGTTILLIASDPGKADTSRGIEGGWRGNLDRSAMVMVLHMTASRHALFVISIPADGVVQIPGVGPGKLSDAATAGGPRLVARTVEEMTGVRMDRLAVLDLNAFREIVDVLDGVVIDVPRESCGLPAGPRRFDGQAALDYIALQPCMERKDLDRVERQQSLVRALMGATLDGGMLTHPFAVNNMMHATVSHLALEQGFSYPSMVRTLWSMRHMRTGNTTFVTVPVAAKPFATQDSTDYVLLDEEADQGLWIALREDQVGQYLALNTDADVLGR
jgi:LCP family protein required for cell wall assembly